MINPDAIEAAYVVANGKEVRLKVDMRTELVQVGKSNAKVTGYRIDGDVFIVDTEGESIGFFNTPVRLKFKKV